MKLLRPAALAAFFSCFLILSGCATQGADQTTQSFQTAATKICAVVQPTLASVASEAALLNPPLSASGSAKLTQAQTVATTFCNTTTVATAATAQGMMNNVFPVVMGVVANSSLDDKTRSALLLSLVGVQTAANVILSQQADATITAPAAPTPTTTRAQ